MLCEHVYVERTHQHMFTFVWLDLLAQQNYACVVMTADESTTKLMHFR